MKIAALVPFKCFTRAKRRLRSHLTPDQVEAVGRAMLDDVLRALGASGVDAVFVLTDDPAVALAAREAGATPWVTRPDPGLNPVLLAAERRLASAGFDASLVVLGDLPLLRARDIDAVLLRGRDRPVIIVPAPDGGTALLWRRPAGCIDPHFGPDSARAHARAAASAGLEAEWMSSIEAPARSDLDTLEDAQRVLASGHPCRTADLLRELLS